MTEPYVELHAASAFSFLEGASLPEALIERACELEMPAMALLDRNGFYGSARFHALAQKKDVRAHVGAEIWDRNALHPAGCLISTHTSRRVCLYCVLRAPVIKTCAR